MEGHRRVSEEVRPHQLDLKNERETVRGERGCQRREQHPQWEGQHVQRSRRREEQGLLGLISGLKCGQPARQSTPLPASSLSSLGASFP